MTSEKPELSVSSVRAAPARKAAYEILRKVEAGDGFAVDFLQGERLKKLSEIDRALTTELVMGVLRWRGELDFRLQQLSGQTLEYFDAEVLTVLRLGIYQIGFLERIPKSAAVNESVELVKAARKRSAARLVNAVLRKCERSAHASAGTSPSEQDYESACRATPSWLLDRWSNHFGQEAARRLAWASVARPLTTLRVSEDGRSREDVKRELARAGVKVRPAKHGSGALVVSRGNVQKTAAWREGRVVIQDEASQLVAPLVAPQEGQRLLDVAAAPGIKTAQLAQSMGRGTLIAGDVSLRRLALMRKLLQNRVPKGVELHLVRLDATRALPFGEAFDRILVDAPCSGTGTLARNPEIKWRLQPQDLERLAKTQAAMLSNAAALLRSGGRLVYATCSLEPEENEQVVETVLAGATQARLIAREDLSREFEAVSGLFDSRGYFRTRPDLDAMDGFFAAVFTTT